MLRGERATHRRKPPVFTAPQKIIVSAIFASFAARMMMFARNAWTCVILLAAVTGLTVRGETADPADAASIEFDLREGGRWNLNASGKPILTSAPLFHVVADGVAINQWQVASTKFTNEDGVLKVS